MGEGGKKCPAEARAARAPGQASSQVTGRKEEETKADAKMGEKKKKRKMEVKGRKWCKRRGHGRGG